MKPIDNKPKTKREKHNRQMEGQTINPYLLQEPESFNKPSQLIKQLVDTPLTTKQKKMYSFFLRELLQQENGSNEIKTTVHDLCKFLGTEDRHIKPDLRKLAKATIIIEEEGKYVTEAQLISSHTMPKEQKGLEEFRTLTIRFDTRLTEVLKEIYSYAKLDLTVLKKLKNTNAITLYEIFKRRLGKRTAGKLNLSEHDMRKYLNLENKYKDNRDFNKNLKKWIQEIEHNSNMSITMERKKYQGNNIYHFIISDFLAMPFNDFKKKILSIGKIEELVFTLNKKRYIFAKHGEDSSYNLEDFLIADYDKWKTYGTEEHLKHFKKNFTLNKKEAEEIWQYLYNQFLDNEYIFIYRFFIINDLDKEYKSISEIEIDEIIADKIDEYFSHFSRS